MIDLWMMLLSAVPFSELRASLPVALQVYHLGDVRALVDVFIGTALPIFPVLYGLQPLIRWTERHVKWIHALMERTFRRAERHLKGRYEKYGAIALFFWVACTIPPTGVWSASIAAVLLGVRPRVAAPAILAGLLVAELIVFALVKGVVGGLKLF